MKIENVTIREIFDSRADSTIEVCVVNEKGGVSCAQVPSGKSRGKDEVSVFDYSQAKEVLTGTIRKLVSHKDFGSIEELDKFLIEFDGMSRKEKLGGNVILGVSMAFARSLAHARTVPLWRVIQEEFFPKITVASVPLIFANFVNGGAHAEDNLDIQEFLVVAKTANSVKETIRHLIELYRAVGDELRAKRKLREIPIGDEGGYALDFKTNLEPLALLESQITKLGYADEFKLGIDAAATGFWKDGTYTFGGKVLSTVALELVYEEYRKKYPALMSLEDPFAETDQAGFKAAVAGLGDAWVVGDDLTTTSPTFIERFAKAKLITGVIIKPNQIGTVSESCEAIKMARANDVKCIVSHRSGETENNFIIHLARAANADGVKIGAPIKERITKYNELLRVYGDDFAAFLSHE